MSKEEKELGCYHPERHIKLTKIADTPEWLRRHFKKEGWNSALNEIKTLFTDLITDIKPKYEDTEISKEVYEIIEKLEV